MLAPGVELVSPEEAAVVTVRSRVSLPVVPAVRSVVSPDPDVIFCCSSPALSGALGCPSSGDGAIGENGRFHNRPAAEVSSAPSKGIARFTGGTFFLRCRYCRWKHSLRAMMGVCFRHKMLPAARPGWGHVLFHCSLCFLKPRDSLQMQHTRSALIPALGTMIYDYICIYGVYYNVHICSPIDQTTFV